MEIPFARFESISLDQIQRSCNLFSLFQRSNFICSKSVFSGCHFSFSGRKWKKPFELIRCQSLDQELKPKPKLNLARLDVKESKDLKLNGTQIKKSGLRICSQIEKLVLCNRFREALELFEFLEIRDCFEVGISTYEALVTACISSRSIRGAKRVFNYMIKNGFEPDQYMRNRILLMHVKCGLMNDACKLFDEMPNRNLVSFNTIILGLVGSGDLLEAFHLFLMMWNEYSDCETRTFALMFSASAGLGFVEAGKQLHACALKMNLGDNIFVSCALIDMYSKCGSIEDAHCVFDYMPEKTTVGWNSIIAGYALHGYSGEALSLCYDMRDSGVFMDHFTFSIIVRICTRLTKLELAKQAHGGLIRRGFGSDIVANTALVDFYSKWVKVDTARHVFEKISNKNLISWNALVAGYANRGRGTEAVELFERMLQEKVMPNHVTFLAVLSACSGSGLSERGWELFQSMTTDHKIKPRAMHYMCMIELLGREGLLDEAFALIRAAPFRPTANMWAALLTASRVQGNLELAKCAAEKLYGMEPEKLGNYVVLFNIYNGMGKTEEANGVLETLKKKGLRMVPACSWIEVRDQTHVFLSGDKCQSYSEKQKREIYNKVDELMEEASEHGYLPEEKTFLPDVDEIEARTASYHSEKLAIAYGLINTPEWTPLQIVQSHRICNDSHNAVKLMALISQREIVVRDAGRFHHFTNGKCSCGDYW